jgi:hypothetical protein
VHSHEESRVALLKIQDPSEAVPPNGLPDSHEVVDVGLGAVSDSESCSLSFHGFATISQTMMTTARNAGQPSRNQARARQR